MKKKLLMTIVLMTNMFVFQGISAMAQELPSVTTLEFVPIVCGEMCEDSDLFETQNLFSKKKSIKKNYSSISDIPASIYYEEYIDGAWWYGNLEWTGDARKIPNTNLYEATFEGTLKKM